MKPIYQNIAKRIVDISVSLILIILFLPIFFILSTLIGLTSKGPVYFRQKRLGKDGKHFTIIKFRTMRVGAPDLRNPDGSTYNSPDDPRLTKVGKFLRKWSLDEFPELFNVLKGDMSLVGPRPDQIDQIKYYTEEEKKKLSVKPGITGWAQINGRNVIPWSERKKLDLYYINNYSFLLDLKILIKTIFRVVKRKDIFVSNDISDFNQNA